VHELIVSLPDGAPAVPYVEVTGESPGPHLTVIARVHGAEYTSVAVAREFARALDPARVHGRIITVAFIRPTDHLVLHAGGVPEALEPFALHDESPAEEHSRRLARASA
jgi:hypothetical protein